MRQLVKIGNVVDFFGGGTPSKSRPEFFNGDVPWVTPKDMKKPFISETQDRITQDAVKESATRLVPTRSVLVVVRSGVLKHTLPVAINVLPVTINQDIKALVCSETICPEYLAHFLRHSAPRILAHVRATTADNIPVDALKSLEIPLPPLPEQRRIAAILDKADALRFQRVISIKRLGSAVDAVFVKEFGDPIANPRNYAVHPLGELCDVRDGTHDSPGYVAEGFPLVTSKNLTAGRVDLTDASLISEEDYVAINRRSKVDRGDILMPMIGTVGNPVIIDHDPGYAVKNVAIIKFLTTSPSNVFVHALMNGPYFDHVTSRNNRGGTQKFVSLGDLRAFPVPLPSRDEQGHFDDRVKGINVLRTSMTASLQVLSKLFCSLQQRAFDGEL